MPQYEAVIFKRSPKQPKGNWTILDSEVEMLDPKTYQEEREVPKETLHYLENVKEHGGAFLWFPFVPHIFVKGIIETNQFEVCNLE